MKILHVLALVALSLVSSVAHARPPMETNQLVDDNGTPIGTAANPLFTSGGGGGSGGGSVTSAGTSGTQAQAVQGIAGGVPQNVRTDQTSHGTTDKVAADLYAAGAAVPTGIGPTTASSPRVTLSYDSSALVYQGTGALTGGNVWVVAEGGSSQAFAGITPVVTQAGTAVVGKAGQGNLYSAYAVNTTATAGYLACINATAAPATGSAISPVDVQPLAGAVGATASINYGAGPPNGYSTGIVCLVTTSLTTYTAGGASFMQVRVR